VYTGMRKATLLVISMLLIVPAAGHAKAGVEFQQYPEEVQPGQPINFTVMAFRDPPASGGAGHAVVGAHPLITFRSRSGAVIRVRASETDLNGIGYGKVIFTDSGPWTTEMNVPGVEIGQERSQPISVGTGLTETIPSADSQRSHQAADPGGSFPWVWVLSLASIASALLVLTMRRRGHWGAV
jgi:hypothetical protein